MSHVHHYDLDRNGLGTCRWTSCPQRVKQHQNTIPQDITPDIWNHGGWTKSPLPPRVPLEMECE